MREAAIRRVGRSLIDAREWLFDLRHSIDTRGDVWSPRVGAAHAESASHGTRYEAARFVCEDATRYRIPTEQSVVFLNNPFDASILRAFLDNNSERFAQTRTLIAYAHDFHRRTILDNRFEILFRDQTLSLSLYRALR